MSKDTLYNELYRPQFHFTAAKNWLNDPNGLVYYKGEYHLFFQHNPAGIAWGNMTWGHAVSTDLVHWKQLDHAIHPDGLGTIFSGSAVVDWNNTAGFGKEAIVCIYTAAGDTVTPRMPVTQCIAYSTDLGRTFTKYAKNPVLGHIAGSNRDPKVIWHTLTKTWIMALYLDKNDFALLSSPDLKQWKQIQTITIPDCDECPDLFPMAVDGDRNRIKWVLTAANGRYLVGDFDGKQFIPNGNQPLPADWGANYYAVQTYSDIPESDGRRIQIAWMRGDLFPNMPFNQQMNFPTELTLRTFPEGLRICRLPAREIESLRSDSRQWHNVQLQPGKDLLAGISGDLFDIEAEIDSSHASEIAFLIRGEVIRYVPAEKQIRFLGKTGPIESIDGRIHLRILVDRASIELFGNDGKLVMTSCFMPWPENKTLGLQCLGGPANVSVTVHTLRSTWNT